MQELGEEEAKTDGRVLACGAAEPDCPRLWRALLPPVGKRLEKEQLNFYTPRQDVKIGAGYFHFLPEYVTLQCGLVLYHRDTMVINTMDNSSDSGWNTLEEVFYVLSNTVNYVILRDFEELPRRFDTNADDCIVLLTDDREQLIRTLNPLKDSPSHPHEQLTVKVGDAHVSWDVRHVGDGYYCLQWEQMRLPLQNG